MAKQTSPTSSKPQARLIQTNPHELKIGMYVDLNCSWFKHPFASKTFKITSENELVIIRSLNLTSILVDPALSDHEGAEQVTVDDSEKDQSGAAIPTKASVQARSSSDSAIPHETITRYSESLQQANAVYKQTLTQSSAALNDIRKGSEAGLMTAKDMINSLTDLVLNDATSSAMGSLLSTQDLDDISVLHAMNVSVLSMLVGRQFDLSHEQTKMLGIAGLLHDIGEQMLPPHLHTREGRMTSESRKEFQQHVNFGLNMLAKFPGLPDTVTDIVRLHHERIDGSGYPAQLKGNQLSLSSRILMAVDEYESLINAPNIRQNLTPAEALSKLYIAGKTTLSEEVVVALIQTLSVYPPGTVVELNDKSIGLVISINLHARMRPLIILYDPTVDQENPNIADLIHDTDRSIARSIPRNELSRDVSSYLNLARWTGYFINSSMKALEEQQAT
jgi:HD-GYP domain-containing protein (c-di-GMP phosphodiesterase class II)